jgi:MarR family transcriptional regulator, transcriptional regulator for hemolysin
MKDAKYQIEDSLGYHIGKTFRLLQFGMERFLGEMRMEITSDDWIILVFLYHKSCTNQQFLSNVIARDKATITRIIDDLESRNYVIRIAGKEDRRQKEIVLTENGKSFVEKNLPHIIQETNKVLENVSKKDLEIFKEVHKKISQNILDRIKK